MTMAIIGAPFTPVMGLFEVTEDAMAMLVPFVCYVHHLLRFRKPGWDSGRSPSLSRRGDPLQPQQLVSLSAGALLPSSWPHIRLSASASRSSAEVRARVAGGSDATRTLPVASKLANRYLLQPESCG
jgi:hypothetical protein